MRSPLGGWDVDGGRAVPTNRRNGVLTSVRLFGPFNGDNDPHGEHDFVSVKVDGETYFGKIDYYAPNMEHGSEDPADEAKTVRVLTIARSSEY
ncbi:hypothetical protein GGQ85_001035 [Nitrobacter vulgaris]|uniref:DUF3768 domain-containing protein n=1 Tax=Nitrobacter vulgaris TaxID=29421 RepID=UPI00285771A2|nr:DUF3768 domain-containing protein [Nitrobacter vulgaris]MDR6303352.1 hypothetical protein [Nitrobacter vulgaris]